MRKGVSRRFKQRVTGLFNVYRYLTSWKSVVGDELTGLLKHPDDKMLLLFMDIPINELYHSPLRNIITSRAEWYKALYGEGIYGKT